MNWIKSEEIGEPFFKPTYPFEKWGKGRPSKEAKMKRQIYNNEYKEYKDKFLKETSFGQLLSNLNK